MDQTARHRGCSCRRALPRSHRRVSYRRGKLGLQTTPWWSPANFGRTNHHGIWLREAIEADELIFMPTASPLSEDICPEAVVWRPIFRNPPHSLTLWFQFSSLPLTQCWAAGYMGGLVMTDPFHNYQRPGHKRIWGLCSLNVALPGWTALPLRQSSR